MIFGAIMLRTGSAKAFLNVAMRVAGRLTGGGAQVAVLASAMMGSLCGSATATSATVGAFTIPMMKRRGYPGPFAGGVESAASSGGLVTPPVMGAGVFIMAEILGIPYLKIAAMALFPALLYFLGIMMMVYFQAKKQKLGRLSGSDIPHLRDYWKELLMLVIPVSVLITLILQMYTPRFAAFWAVVLNLAVFLVLAIPIGKSFCGPTVAANCKSAGSTMVAGLVEGGGNAATLGVLVAGAQIMVGALGITGLGLKLSQMVISMGITYLFPLLFATMVIACVLGGPLPVVPTYLITAAVTVPLLTPYGLPAVLVHLFIYYYACFSGLTPPVYGPVYSSAVFAEASVLETGWESMKCAFIGFTVPFVFVYNPALIGLRGYGAAFAALLVGAAATLVVASAIVGYWDRPLTVLQRALLAVGGFMIIAPETWTRIAGFAVSLGMALLLWLSGRQAPAVEAQSQP
jgi:TRAP transporter 4TM/12TM fusion protein